jgi:hypothetical protein
MDDWGSALKIYGIIFGSILLVLLIGNETLTMIMGLGSIVMVIVISIFGGGGGGSGGGRDGANY